MISGLFSINEDILPDPIMRLSEHVNRLFNMGYLNLILEHNENCLLSTLILLQKRYFKLT